MDLNSSKKTCSRECDDPESEESETDSRVRPDLNFNRTTSEEDRFSKILDLYEFAVSQSNKENAPDTNNNNEQMIPSSPEEPIIASYSRSRNSVTSEGSTISMTSSYERPLARMKDRRITHRPIRSLSPSRSPSPRRDTTVTFRVPYRSRNAYPPPTPRYADIKELPEPVSSGESFLSRRTSDISSTIGSVGTASENNEKMLDNAARSMSRLLDNLKRLWCNVRDGGLPLNPLLSFTGESNLVDLTNLCSFIVDEMENDWRKVMTTPTEKTTETSTTIADLQKMNAMLNGQIQHFRAVETGLQNEIIYIQKEKALLGQEVKELSMQLAEKQLQVTRNPSFEKPKFDISKDFINVNSPSARKREDDFDSILQYVERRRSDMNFVQTQFEKYDESVEALQAQLQTITLENDDLQKMNDFLTEKQTALARERDHFQTVLKLILQEKQSDEACLHELLQTLICKMSEAAGSNENSNPEASLMESAIRAVQEQNANYREEIGKLKQDLKESSERKEAMLREWEGAKAALGQQINELLEVLKEKNEALRISETYYPLVEENAALTSTKLRLEKALHDKDEEMKRIQDGVQTMQKTNLRQLKKCHELQNLNTRLKQDLTDHKKNMESLSRVVYQLRDSLKEQDAQWRDRLKAGADEVAQANDNNKWLQSQVEHLNGQLVEAHQRIKAHELDKTCLAQQVISAEEERKMIDRKLHELRTALQGDTVLREALMERNEALQIEINRLRKARLMGHHSFSEDAELNPPSEMSNLEALNTLNAIPPSSNPDRFGLKKNRYTASFKRDDQPRTVASMHTPSGGGQITGSGK